MMGSDNNLDLENPRFMYFVNLERGGELYRIGLATVYEILYQVSEIKGKKTYEIDLKWKVMVLNNNFRHNLINVDPSTFSDHLDGKFYLRGAKIAETNSDGQDMEEVVGHSLDEVSKNISNQVAQEIKRLLDS